MDSLVHRRYAIIDIEGIALDKWRPGPVKGRYSNIHYCLRKVGVELWDSSARCFEFSPCLKMMDLTHKERQSFKHCRRFIHHLEYDPHRRPPCASGETEIFNFLNSFSVDLILFKGGTIERDLCYTMGFESINLEDFGVSKAPECLGHDPMREVRFYHEQLRMAMVLAGL